MKWTILNQILTRNTKFYRIRILLLHRCLARSSTSNLAWTDTFSCPPYPESMWLPANWTEFKVNAWPTDREYVPITGDHLWVCTHTHHSHNCLRWQQTGLPTCWFTHAFLFPIPVRLLLFVWKLTSQFKIGSECVCGTKGNSFDCYAFSFVLCIFRDKDWIWSFCPQRSLTVG